MTEIDINRLQKRGRAAELQDEIKTLSREFANLMRPLRDRCNQALPIDKYPSDVANNLDVVAARQELESVARVSLLLDELIAEHDAIASELNLAKLRKILHRETSK